MMPIHTVEAGKTVEGKPIMKPVFQCDEDGCKETANFKHGDRWLCPLHWATTKDKGKR